MNKFLCTCVIAATVVRATPTLADEQALPVIQTPSSEPDPGNTIAPMKRFQAAPFTGLLLSPKAAAMIVVEMSSFSERIKIEVEKATAEVDATCKFKLAEQKTEHDWQIALKDAEIEKQIAVNEALKERLQKSESGLSGGTWFGIGLGVGATAITVAAVSIAYVAAR